MPRGGIRIMSLEHAILGFLDRGPMTGYDLKTRCFDRDASHFWTADQAQVYRTLDRLVTRRLVTSRLVPQRGKPDRRVYSVTDNGRSELRAWVAQPLQPAPLRDGDLFRLYFGATLDDAALETRLSEARRGLQERLDGVRARSSALRITTREKALARMTLDAAAASLRAEIDWIDDCIERVREGLPAPEEVS
ncbi:MAG: PadR family transcriptional regulator [Coriobacteriaceae bacterium]|nr:PadR family transcriptional regulator [Coriobacteriaceae bacterium]